MRLTLRNDMLEDARRFIYYNARPIDLARWQYHFENVSKERVLEALSFYQNEDGGFGHALEADVWNPNSSPIQTWTATEILWEISISDRNHPIIQGILVYLESGSDFNGSVWHNSVKSNNDYPHAPWWHVQDNKTSDNNYNPTACLAGFIVKFASEESKLFQLGYRIANEAIELIISGPNQSDMHVLACYVRLLEYIQTSGHHDKFDIQALREKLLDSVTHCITTDISAWNDSYICKPSQFFCSKASVFYPSNIEVAEYECRYIIETQCADGSWDIPWEWSEYPEQWAISKNWWKANIIINNLLYLKGLS